MNSVEGARRLPRSINQDSVEDAFGELHHENTELSDQEISALYTECALRIERSLAQKFHQLSEQDIQDIVIDSFMKLVQKNKEGAIRNEHDKSLYALLHQIAHNTALDAVRRRSHVNRYVEWQDGSSEVSQDNWLDTASMQFSDRKSTDPEAWLLEQEHIEETKQLIEKAFHTPGLLNEGQKEVLRLRFFEDKKHEEVAEELGIPVNTSMTREWYALKKIRKHFHIPDVKRTKRGVKKIHSETPMIEDVDIAAK